MLKQGVGEVENYHVFVPYVIVGETARVKINYVKRNVAYGDAVEIISPSPLRVKPACPLFGKCGGCSLMQMSYDEQLVFKRNKVEQNLRKIGKLDCEVLPCVPSSKQLKYRNKLSLPLCGKRGNAYVGMYRKNTHSAVKIDGCMLSDGWSEVLIREFTAYVNELRIAPYDERTFKGEVRHLVARYVDGQLLVAIVSNGEFNRDTVPLIKRLGKYFDRFGLFVNVNENKNNVILGKSTRHVYGLKYIESEHLGVKFRLQIDSFFQVNNEVKDAIYGKVKELLDVSQTEALIDCFSGVGVLTNVLASDGFDTYAIEIDPSAVEDAKALAELNGKHITNICGDANVELPKLTKRLSGKRITMVVDPPRKGLGEKICDTIISANVDNVVYVSCDSATLARDLAMLAQAYDVTYVEPYDLFPQTDQVETLVHLSKKSQTSHIEVDVEFGEGEGQFSLKKVKQRAEARKPKEKVTYKMIKDYIEQTYGFKVHTAYIAEVKRDFGLPMYDAPNAVEQLKRPRQHPTPKMVEAIKETLKHGL